MAQILLFMFSPFLLTVAILSAKGLKPTMAQTEAPYTYFLSMTAGLYSAALMSLSYSYLLLYPVVDFGTVLSMILILVSTGYFGKVSHT